MMKRFFLLASLYSVSVVTGSNTDLFNYDTTDGTDYGPEDWGSVTCDDLDTCTGWPEKWQIGYGWGLEQNDCQWCPEGSTRCGSHHQSPIDLKRNKAIMGDPNYNQCIDWHWMKYEDSTCTWDQMVQGNAFSIERHALKMSQPLEPTTEDEVDLEGLGYRLKCPRQDPLLDGPNTTRLFGRMDFSKGFPQWWFLSHVDFKVPSEHTQEGKRYSAEVQYNHFYSRPLGYATPETPREVNENEMATVSIFLEVYDDSPPYPFLDKLICEWRRVEDQIREECGLMSVDPYPGCFNAKRGHTPMPTNAPTAPPSDLPTMLPTVTTEAPILYSRGTLRPTDVGGTTSSSAPFTEAPVGPQAPVTLAPQAPVEPSSEAPVAVAPLAPVVLSSEVPVTVAPQAPVEPSSEVPVAVAPQAPAAASSSSSSSSSAPLASEAPVITTAPVTETLVATQRSPGGSTTNRRRRRRLGQTTTVESLLLPRRNKGGGMGNEQRGRVILDPQNFRDPDMTEDEWADWAELQSAMAQEEEWQRKKEWNAKRQNDMSSLIEDTVDQEEEWHRDLANGTHTPFFHNYQFIIDVRTEYYFRYQGTSTIPPCYAKWDGTRANTNHWRVYKDPIRVHERQILEMERLLKERVAPDTCKEGDTAAKVDSDGRVSVARPLMQPDEVHYQVFCECINWPSKWPEDRAWCALPFPKNRNQLYRFYESPYNFNTSGQF